MNVKGAMITSVVCGITLGIVSCVTSTTKSNSAPVMMKASLSTRQMTIRQDALPHQPIRSIDFANFTYPWVSELGDPKKSFALIGGEFPGNGIDIPMTLRSIAQGDVTGDGVEEAIIVLSVVVVGGTARPHIVYIYAVNDERPNLLWTFATGDRADAGLRQVYSDNGYLVIDRYGRDGIVGDCCPNVFIRTHYEWQGNRFHQRGAQEILPNFEGRGWPIMPIYHFTK